MILESICAFGLVGYSCEIGERLTSEFDEISDTIDKLIWYKFPMEVQRILPTIILIAQQELAIECFGSILCLRISFKSVSTVAIKNIPVWMLLLQGLWKKFQNYSLNTNSNVAFLIDSLLVTQVCVVFCRWQTQPFHILWFFVSSISEAVIQKIQAIYPTS